MKTKSRAAAFRKARPTALGGGLLFAERAAGQTPKPARSNLIAQENVQPGSLNWQLTRVRLDKAAGFRAPDIEGYCCPSEAA